MTIDCDNKDFLIQKGLWKGRKLYDLFLDEIEHQINLSYAKQKIQILFSTPFDISNSLLQRRVILCL